MALQRVVVLVVVVVDVGGEIGVGLYDFVLQLALLASRASLGLELRSPFDFVGASQHLLPPSQPSFV